MLCTKYLPTSLSLREVTLGFGKDNSVVNIKQWNIAILPYQPYNICVVTYKMWKKKQKKTLTYQRQRQKIPTT